MNFEELIIKNLVNTMKILIEQIESQNATSITVDDLKTFIHNIENNTAWTRS